MSSSGGGFLSRSAPRLGPGPAGLALLLAACASGDAASPVATAASTPALPDPSGTPGDGEPTSGAPAMVEYVVPSGSHPHDVAPAPDGTVWFSAQGAGALGRLNPRSGEAHLIPLGTGSSPHGVIVGPDGAAWVTDSGLNAIVRVDPSSEEVMTYFLPPEQSNVNLNTAAFDSDGILWFTGQAGFYGRLDPRSGEIRVLEAPGGRGPYGITATPSGEAYYASLAGNHIARIDLVSCQATVIEPPTPSQGARRVWSDSLGRIWVSEWNAGQLGMYDPAGDAWREWRLPGPNPMPYAVYVDSSDIVWLSDFGANALVRFDPTTESFEAFPLHSPSASVRQLLGAPGQVWGAESSVDRIVLLELR